MAHLTCAVADCDRAAGTRGWCDKHYRRWLKHGDPNVFMTNAEVMKRRAKPLHERLLSRLSATPDGCWEWTGPTFKTGYGAIKAGGRGTKVLYVHRAVYELFVGPIPDGLTLDHLCHNRSTDCAGGDTCRHRRCANPDHLAVVTRGENSLSAPITREQRSAWGRKGAAVKWARERARK